MDPNERDRKKFDRDMFHDYVIAHGFGPPTEEGYALGFSLIAGGDDISTAATEVVARGLTAHGDDAPNVPCVRCGRDDLPLHFNRRCPECWPGEVVVRGLTTRSDDRKTSVIAVKIRDYHFLAEDWDEWDEVPVGEEVVTNEQCSNCASWVECSPNDHNAYEHSDGKYVRPAVYTKKNRRTVICECGWEYFVVEAHEDSVIF